MRKASAVLLGLGLATAAPPLATSGAADESVDAEVTARIARLRTALLAQLPQGDGAEATDDFAQWPNFWNCRYGYWRNC